jgi:hypothetical protein
MTARYTIIECEQGSPEWHEARRGLPTASRFPDMLAQGQGKMRAKYRRQLAAEIVSNITMETFTNAAMDRGKKQEDVLRAKYAFDADVNVETVGFLRSTLMRTGCSPDGLVGTEGMVEVKSTAPDLLVEIFETGKAPLSEHKAQIQGCLWITGRRWCDLVIGSPGLPQSVTRIERDEPFMANLRRELDYFNQEIDQLVAHLRTYL